MILQALNGYYDRVAVSGTGDIAPYGFSEQKISFEVLLRTDGSVVDVNDLREMQGKRPTPSMLRVPQPPKKAGKNPPPAFLWDKTPYVFGVESSATDKTKHVDNAVYRASFVAYHEKLLAGSTDIGLLAFLAFLSNWSPARYAELRHSEQMLDTNVVFRMDGEHQRLHDRAAAKVIWEREGASETGLNARCLVSGLSAPIARLHASIKGVQGAQSSGASLLSYNLDAFESYGKEQGANAPVSEAAAFAYTTALNALLSRTSGRDTKDRPIYRNRVQIGDATTVYWAEAAAAEQAASAEDLMAAIFSPPGDTPSDDDQSATVKLRDVISKMADGQPIEQAAPNLASDAKFFVLGLSPNAARISVRFWHVTTLGELGRAFQLHWQDLKIDGPGSPRPPAIWQLVSRIAPARRNAQGVVKYDTKNVPPNLAGEMMRAILSGGAYPRTLFSNIVMRFRADHEIDRLRISMLKAALVRDMRRANPTLPKETYVSLNRDDPDPAYRLGRLFAILEKTQRAAMDGVNSTICDRYYGAAAATPQRVFAFLIKNSKNHLASLRKGRGAKWVKKPAATGGWLDRQIGEIYETFAGTIPATLTLEAQSRFAIGYYHEKYAKRDDAPEDLKSPEPETVSELSDDADATAND